MTNQAQLSSFMQHILRYSILIDFIFLYYFCIWNRSVFLLSHTNYLPQEDDEVFFNP